jgi:hypothetical protein
MLENRSPELLEEIDALQAKREELAAKLAEADRKWAVEEIAWGLLGRIVSFAFDMLL